MEHVNVKIFAEPGAQVALEEAIPVFHRWIQKRDLPELLIDVTDYSHVPAGPGVLLIGHEANYSLDNGHNELGVLYNRKAPVEGDSLKQAYESALVASARLEQEFEGKLKFRHDEVEVTLNDRLLHPNTEEGWAAVRGQLEQFFDGLFEPGHYTVQKASDPRERLWVRARRTN
ncbi:hypothetical protein [uncultured Paludibaculum sp.]|uniref:hypothetical protein n=1 Tax=uncultured Paludibaculum sp. TaxID=1765020 RepID=UPI002AAAD3F4|nr:hypothetical protein [uncultured Paludibaculum sp.]